MNATLAHRKVLVVDDEPHMRQTLDFCLRDQYDIIAVASGDEALAEVRREAYPVVILDLCMQGLSGLETLKKLKEIRETQNVIILTAYQTVESAVSALNLGAFCYLTKPFEHLELREAVARGVDAFDHQVIREREMKERLLQVHDAFFSLLCHEFNTPMNIVLGFSDLLASSIADPEQAAWVEEIRKSGTHLHEILMEVVDYMAASHHAVSGRNSIFCPRELLAPLVATFEAREIQLTVSEGCSPSRFVIGPSQAVFLIARKLVSMASRGKSSNISLCNWVDALDDGVKAVLHLEVTGTGLFRSRIDPATLAELFEPYHFPADHVAGQRMTLGLELATSRKIAEYSAGSIEVFPAENDEFGFLAKIPVRLSPVL